MVAIDSLCAGSGTKKEGLMTKLKEKLPGHHGASDDTSMDQTDSMGAPPKKGLMTKIKEKLPGNHGSSNDMWRIHQLKVHAGTKTYQQTSICIVWVYVVAFRVDDDVVNCQSS